MAQSFKHPNAVNASLRQLAEGYAKQLGPAGLAAYVAQQDLLLLTDVYSAMVLRPATNFVKQHRLGRITGFTLRRGEFPGAQSIVPEIMETADDEMYLKSLVSERSVYAAELIALVQAQAEVSLTKRKELNVVVRPEGIKLSAADFTVPVSEAYYESILKNGNVTAYSGVIRATDEPTDAWKPLAAAEKGVFFRAGDSLCGLLMPLIPNIQKIQEAKKSNKDA